jgi:hypothetical protein
LFAEVTPTSELVCPNDPVQIWLLVALEVAELLFCCLRVDIWIGSLFWNMNGPGEAYVLQPSAGVATVESNVVVVGVAAYACGPGGVSHLAPHVRRSIMRLIAGLG